MKAKDTETLIIGLAIFAGLLFPFLNVLGSLLFLFLFAFLSLMSVGFIICSIFLGRKSLKVGIIGLIPILIGFGLTTLIRRYKHNKAEEIKVELNASFIKNGRYPDSLSSELKNHLNGLYYEPLNNNKEYRLEYLMDTYNREYYKSEGDRWGTLGWND
jgi:hypothetical protein